MRGWGQGQSGATRRGVRSGRAPRQRQWGQRGELCVTLARSHLGRRAGGQPSARGPAARRARATTNGSTQLSWALLLQVAQRSRLRARARAGLASERTFLLARSLSKRAGERRSSERSTCRSAASSGRKARSAAAARSSLPSRSSSPAWRRSSMCASDAEWSAQTSRAAAAIASRRASRSAARSTSARASGSRTASSVRAKA